MPYQRRTRWLEWPELQKAFLAAMNEPNPKDVLDEIRKRLDRVDEMLEDNTRSLEQVKEKLDDLDQRINALERLLPPF